MSRVRPGNMLVFLAFVVGLFLKDSCHLYLEVFDATKPQLACWQEGIPGLVPGPFTEDCLSLNIYTPEVFQQMKVNSVKF